MREQQHYQRGYYEICPVCFWEDYNPREVFGQPTQEKPYSPNNVSLWQAREFFLIFGVSERKFQLYVRFPHEEEIPETFPTDKATFLAPESQIAVLLAEAQTAQADSPKPALAWFNALQMPALRWGTGEVVPQIAIKYLLYCQLQTLPLPVYILRIGKSI